MSEFFLHYVWQFQYYNKIDLQTVQGDKLIVLQTGKANHDAGPDFLQAKIQLGDITWFGHVEIHVKSSEWVLHGHWSDKGYENVVLHVVWENDQQIFHPEGRPIPTLELKSRIDEELIFRYYRLIHQPNDIPCGESLHAVPHIVFNSMVDKVMIERLREKASSVLTTYRKNEMDWEETTYQVLLRSFGFKVNADAFSHLANAISMRTLLRHADRIELVEALLFGQAGFLDSISEEDPYMQLLKREYHVLQQKYNLQHAGLHKSQWKFLRLRPANFPTLRIAQFAALLVDRKLFYTSVIECESFNDMVAFFSVAPSPYWRKHYSFGKQSPEGEGIMGKSSIQSVIINAVIPLYAAYSIQHDEQELMDKAIDFLQEIKGEQNHIVSRWNHYQKFSVNAFDSQALIHLYNHYCLRRRCLDCTIGNYLVKPGPK